jgi:hypothetical protein
MVMEKQSPQEDNKSVHVSKGSSKDSTIAIIAIVMVLGFGFVFYKIVNHGESGGSSAPALTPSFNDLVQPRFASLKEAAPEISSIDCESGDCRYVVYLNLTKVPDDLEVMVRGNTATLSKFKQYTLGTSNISVAAKYNGKVIYACQGSDGQVNSCQNY